VVNLTDNCKIVGDEISEFSVDNSTSGGVKVVTSSSDTLKLTYLLEPKNVAE